MEPDERAPGAPRQTVSATARRGVAPWLKLLAVAAVGLAVVGVLLGGDGGARDGRAAALALGAEDFAAVWGDGVSVMRTSPPLDIGAVERAARAALLGQVADPASRALVSYRRGDTGAEVTTAVLVYDDSADAATLVARGAPLLASALGLLWEEIELAGTADARRWSGQGYQGVSFRIDGILALVATTDPGAATALRLAEEAREKVRRAGPGLTAAVETARPAAATGYPAP